MGGDALSQLLCLVYNVNAQSEADVDYHLSKRKWKWFDHPFEKTKVMDLYMGVMWMCVYDSTFMSCNVCRINSVARQCC